MRSLLLPALVLLSIFASAQNYEKVWFDRSDSVYGYYSVIPPTGGRVQGAMVLFDGFGGDASSFLAETKLHNVASANDLLTVCLPTGRRLFLDDIHLKMIHRILNEVAKKYGIKNDRFAMGGFSSGGTVALRYVELCYEHPEEFEIKPRAAFTVDSPLDVVGRYKASKRIIASGVQGFWVGEAKMINEMCDAELGKPEVKMANYRRISPFTREDSAAGNERFLKTVAYRTYHDVDVAWWLQNRQMSIDDTNIPDGSELVNRLQLMGNKEAEFMASKIPGRRANGMRHPHSWNIVDETDLVQWIKEKLDFYPGDISKKYSFDLPGWSAELMLLPMDFAPQIKYKGFEDLRFAPGWADAASNEKWAYVFVWYLDEKYSFDEKNIQSSLVAYYTGLTKRRAIADKDDVKNWFPATATVNKTDASPGDLAAWAGTAKIYDAHVTKKPATLYFRIHQKAINEAGKTVLFFEISGFPSPSPVWNKMEEANQHLDLNGGKKEQPGSKG